MFVLSVVWLAEVAAPDGSGRADALIATVWSDGRTTGRDAADVFWPTLAGSCPEIVVSVEFPVVWSVAVAAPEGKGSEAADTARVAISVANPMDSDAAVLLAPNVAGSLLLIAATVVSVAAPLGSGREATEVGTVAWSEANTTENELADVLAPTDVGSFPDIADSVVSVAAPVGSGWDARLTGTVD